MRAFLFILAILFSVSGQVQVVSTNRTVTLSWECDSSDFYLLYSKKYGEDQWVNIGMTTEKNCTVEKGTNKSRIVFGVSSVYKGDTSEIHSSLDSTACIEKDPTSISLGSWYLYWTTGKPKWVYIE